MGLQGFERQAKERGLARLALLKNLVDGDTPHLGGKRRVFQFGPLSSKKIEDEMKDGPEITASSSPGLIFSSYICSQVWEFPCKDLGSEIHPHYSRAKSKPQSPVM